VKNKDGQRIFAVYNDGVRIYVDDGDAKGGFAIALIYGEFDTDKLQLNATVTVRDALALQPRLEPPPGLPIEGEMYYDSDDHKLFVYDGSDW